jgi:hypothetical protein
MAIVYYPKNQLLYARDTTDQQAEAIVLSSTPNVVLYFGTASVPTSASALDLPITASWARSASISNTYNTFTSGGWATQSLSSSYSLSGSYVITASYATNAGGGGTFSTASGYATLTTSSFFGITASFSDLEEYVNITLGAAYYFTCSNMPPANSASNVSLYLKNTSAATSSLSFPSSWTFIGAIPTYLSSSKSAILSLKAFGPEIVAAWGQQY